MNTSEVPELSGHCPVAYFALNEPMPGNPEYSSTYLEKVYYLVNEEAKQEFDKDPEKYIPAFDGLCAFGMSIEKEFEADPTHFKIIDGKLHLFLKNDDTDALELWNKEDEATCLANAKQYWESRSIV
ncbi:YHS domain-containing (seleno)protein [Thalassoglobus sp. JC818]|uniref:YHS domain-containing (seleno)protein n=1 Tax=Thalassoglobus sp. JC818 TaxID=3232136 RepID=UPI003459C54C